MHNFVNYKLDLTHLVNNNFFHSKKPTYRQSGFSGRTDQLKNLMKCLTDFLQVSNKTKS